MSEELQAKKKKYEKAVELLSYSLQACEVVSEELQAEKGMKRLKTVELLNYAAGSRARRCRPIATLFWWPSFRTGWRSGARVSVSVMCVCVCVCVRARA